MGFAQGSRVDAIKALINMWLKDPRIYCANCGMGYHKCADEACCEEPFIGDNKLILAQYLEDNKLIRQTRMNQFASNKSKTMRHLVSIPAELYFFLTKAFEKQYKEKLFNEEYDDSWFARNFPMFCIPEKI